MFLLLRVEIVRGGSNMRERIFERGVGRGVESGLWRFGISLFFTSALAREAGLTLKGILLGTLIMRW